MRTTRNYTLNLSSFQLYGTLDFDPLLAVGRWLQKGSERPIILCNIQHQRDRLPLPGQTQQREHRDR